MLNALLTGLEWLVKLLEALWQLLVVAFFLAPAGYLFVSGLTEPKLGVFGGAILAAFWLGFASVVSTLFNVACRIDRWANRF